MGLVVRRFPDVQIVLVTGLEDLAGGAAHIGIETPDNLATVLPFVRVRRFGGGNDRFYDFALVDIDVFGARYTDTEAMAERIRQFLVGPPPAITVLDRVDCTTAPRELPWDQGRVRRFGATYTTVTRRRAVLT